MCSHIRSIAKGCTWRVIASADTFLLGWLVTGQIVAAVSIAGIEVFTKIAIYYAHERAWELLK